MAGLTLSFDPSIANASSAPPSLLFATSKERCDRSACSSQAGLDHLNADDTEVGHDYQLFEHETGDNLVLSHT